MDIGDDELRVLLNAIRPFMAAQAPSINDITEGRQALILNRLYYGLLKGEYKVERRER